MNDGAQRIPAEVDVVVCGGGPVGLSMSYLLGRAGVRVAMFERRASTTTLPKGQYLHASTGEFFKQWGVWDLLEDKGWSTESSNGQGFYVNVAKGPVAVIRAIEGTHAEYVRKWEPLSPVFPRKVPASDYEAAIRRQAAQWPGATLHFNTRLIDIEASEQGVRVVVEDAESHAQRTVSAKYLVACDGAHSFVRSRVGQGQDHGPTFGNQILVEFRAALDDTLGEGGFFHSFILHPHYAGWFGSKHPETGLWRYSFRHDEEDLPSADVVLERLRGALGMRDLPIEIVRFHRFDYTTGLLRRWREGPVFFAGDAAHWHSPWGGFGMNSGVQDANNLAWKLDLVLRGVASDELLDTYEVERRSKALVTVKSATYNSLHYQAIAEAVRVGEGELLRQGRISAEAVTFLSQRVAPHGDYSVLHTGYQLGTVYASGAIDRANEEPPTPALREYVETTVPGVRAPHAWLVDSRGARVSTIELWGRSFTLVGHELAGYWQDACEALARRFDMDLDLLNVSEAGRYRPFDAKFRAVFGRHSGEAILVRPDGFIAARIAAAGAAQASRGLERAMRIALGRGVEAESTAPGCALPRL
ncbi:MAG: FAD-dependent monooxygenase [Variovorax sp.]|nr:FAD-dependent monooxygenase [Variovorax sp.]